MRHLNLGRVCGPVAAIALTACLWAPAFAAGDEPLAYDDPVVPPGQEALFGLMFGSGAALPGDCKFAGGGADGPVIRALYACPAGEVVFELLHPDNAGPAAVLTDRFAITLVRGAPPVELGDAVVWMVRSREAGFEWLWLHQNEDSADEGGDEGNAPPASEDSYQ